MELLEYERDVSPDKYRMFVTRHGTSCNNITGNVSKKKDPSLSISGIVTLILYKSVHIDEFEDQFQPGTEQPEVYVSASVRTWMTALLLYGRNRDKLTLIVSPFIKEEGEDYGNMPENKSIQEMKFNNFLKFLAVFTYLTKETEDAEFVSFSKCKVSVLCDGNSIFDFDSADNISNSLTKLYDHDFKNYWTSFKTHKVQYTRNSVNKTIFNETPVLSLPRKTSNPSKEYPGEMLTFYPDGLLRFYDWVRPKQWPIFVISHSHLMQHSLQSILKNPNVELEHALHNLNNIFETNAWTVEFQCVEDSPIQKYIMPKSFILGIQKPDDNLIKSKFEKLCLQDQGLYGEFFDKGHAQQSRMVKDYLPKLPRVLLGKAGNYASKKYRRLVAGKKRSHRKRRTQRIRKRSRRF